MTFQSVKDRGLDKYHMSGGANDFKRKRGAISTVECMVVFVNDLPFYQRWIWKFVKIFAEKIITPDRE